MSRQMQLPTRPTKGSKAPPPLYAGAGSDAVPYCHTCGRVMSARKSHETAAKSDTPAKYCSDRCRRKKPGNIDRDISQAFVTLLDDDSSSRKKPKGESRNTITCSEVDELVHARPSRGTEKKLGSRGKRAAGDTVEEWRSVDMEDSPVEEDEDEDHSDGGVPLLSDGRHTRKAGDDMGTKRREGQTRAEELERVKQAARRGCVFGFDLPDGTVRKCEALMKGRVVEPSFAKGDWAVRWRER